MAVDYLPASWITGTVVTDATYLQIPWSSLATATQSEIDIRKILRDVADAIETTYADLVDTDAANTIPTKFLPTTNTKYNDSTGEFEEQHGQKFDLTVDSTSLPSDPG